MKKLALLSAAPGGSGMEQLVGWSRGDHGGPVWERFLEEGFVVAVVDFRGGDLPQGEILLQGALERSLAFVRSGRLQKYLKLIDLGAVVQHNV